jgi:hypothetical protein
VLLNLPAGCQVFTQGLILPPGLDYDEWMRIGSHLTTLLGAVMWMWGDWLAFGQTHYIVTKWGNRLPDGIYKECSRLTGYAEGTLRNAKCVCAALPLSQRCDKLTYGHALEIVARVPEGQFEFWVNKVAGGEFSVRILREQIRKSQATFKPEPNDMGTHSFLETARQFVRDYMAEKSIFTEKYRAELVKILTPVFQDLG